MSVKEEAKTKLVEIKETFHKLVFSLRKDQNNVSLAPLEKNTVENEELFLRLQALTFEFKQLCDNILQNQNKQREINSLKKEIEIQENEISDIVGFIAKKHASINKTLHLVDEQYENAKNPKYLVVDDVMSYGHKVTSYMNAPVDYPDSTRVFPPCPQPGIDWGKSLLYPHNLMDLTKALEDQPVESVQAPLITNMDFGYKFKTQIQPEPTEEIELFTNEDSD
jgi:hypothetical protein